MAQPQEIKLIEVEESEIAGINEDDDRPIEQKLASTMSITRASVTRVPAATVAEEIVPRKREFATPNPSFQVMQEVPLNQAPIRTEKKRNFFASFFQKRYAHHYSDIVYIYCTVDIVSLMLQESALYLSTDFIEQMSGQKIKEAQILFVHPSRWFKTA